MRIRSWLLTLAGVTGLAAACAPAAAPAAVPAAPAPAAPAPAPRPEEPPFYAGKTIRWIVGHPPGGGYDVTGRLVAKHISRFIPGNPTIVVENIPGGGSLISANTIYKAAKPDGLTVAGFGEGLVLQQLLGQEGIEFDARKFPWIGASIRDTWACVARGDRGLKSIADTIGAAAPLVLGATAPGAGTSDFSRALQAGLGANIQLVLGYPGTAQIRLAMDRKEVDGGCWTWESIKATSYDTVQSGEYVMLAQQAPRRHPDLQNVPLASELAKTEEAKQLLVAVSGHSAFAKPWTTAPGTPPERVQILREAFSATHKDPQFLEEAKAAKLDIFLTPAEEIERLVAQIFTTPPETVKRLAEVLK